MLINMGPNFSVNKWPLRGVQGESMAKFVEFEDADSKTTVWINPDHVRAIRPSPDDPNITTLFYNAGDGEGVEGNHEEVAKKLTT
jgi:hypothetical protein